MSAQDSDTEDWTREDGKGKLYQASVVESGGGRGGVRARMMATARVKASEDDDEDCCCCPLDPVLAWFRLFHLISGLVGCASMGANGYILATKDAITMDYKDIVTRTYAIIFCFIVVLAEIDWRYVMRRIRILDLWFFRGLFYFYVGFITLGNDTSLTDPVDMAALAQICMGGFYCLMVCLVSLLIVFVLDRCFLRPLFDDPGYLVHQKHQNAAAGDGERRP